MKERFKMIFDRIDIFVVCIILGSCLCIAEAFLGIWDEFAGCFVITLLAAGVCYTLRCNEKLEIELIETKEKLKEKEKELVEVNWKLMDTEMKLESACLQAAKKSKVADVFRLLRDLWKERWECEHAKVLYCKRRITSKQLVDAMNHAEKECGEISDKISELTKEFNELYAKK